MKIDKFGEHICQGVSVSGYWKGYPCGNTGKYITNDNHYYCATHYAIAQKNPERFEKARQVLKNKEKKNGNTTKKN